MKSAHLTIVYNITSQQQVSTLLEHTDWSAASHSHAIHERDEACKQRDELLKALQRLVRRDEADGVTYTGDHPVALAKALIVKVTGSAA